MVSAARPTIIIQAFDLQRLVNEFTLANRAWTGYPIDKVEHMMKFYNVLPAGFYYARFDADTDEVIFQAQPYGEHYTQQQIRGACKNLPASAKLLLGSGT